MIIFLKYFVKFALLPQFVEQMKLKVAKIFFSDAIKTL